MWSPAQANCSVASSLSCARCQEARDETVLHTPGDGHSRYRCRSHRKVACANTSTNRRQLCRKVDVTLPKVRMSRFQRPFFRTWSGASLGVIHYVQEATMRAAEPMTETERIHRVSENLLSQLSRGREWATPGVQVALERAVAGLDAGIETASPRLQALLRRLSAELAGGVETLTPRIQDQLKRVAPKAAAPAPVQARWRAPRVWLWILGLTGLAAGAAVWRSMKTSKEEPAPSSEQETDRTDPNVDADLTAGRM